MRSSLFALELLQRHCSERSSVAHATLRKLDDLPGDETRCGIVHHFQAQVSHTLWSAADILSMVSGSNACRDRNGRIGMVILHVPWLTQSKIKAT